MSEIFYPAALTCRFDQPFIKTVILLSVAAMWCVPCLAKDQSADAQLPSCLHRRMEMAPGTISRARRSRKTGSRSPAESRSGDAGDAAPLLAGCVHKLADINRAQLSPEEQINYDVYRPEIENFVADQKFRDYEMPANSDSAFWTDFSYTARRPFKTLTDYNNWIAQMRDIPRYFREQIPTCERGSRAVLRRRSLL